MPNTLSKKLKIINKLGLHARASAKFVNVANRYSCDLHVIRGSKKVNGKSIMGIMMLAASQGTEIEIKASGEEAEQALSAIEDLIQDRFGETE